MTTRPKQWLLTVPLGLIWFGGTPATAQITSLGGKDIIVTGRTAPKLKEVTRQAEAVSATTDRLDSSLARFPDPVCPTVYGLSPELNSLIAARMRKDAAAAGMAIAKEKCEANAIVVFVTNGQAEIKTLTDTRPELFAGLSLAERRALANASGPVHCWRRIAVLGRQGDRLDSAGGLDTPSLKVDWPSHLVLSTQLAIEGAIVVIDLPATMGKTVAQLADYASMRLFVETRPPSTSAPIATILSLFDSTAGTPPASLTAFDVAYLKSVYEAAAGQTGISTLGSVAHTLRKDAARSGR